VIISITVQTVILAYINYVYLPGTRRVKTTIYEYYEPSIDSWSLKIPKDSSKIRASFNGRYVGYMRDGKLIVQDAANGNKKIVVGPDDGKLTYFKWLPDRGIIIYSLSLLQNGYCDIQIATYNAESGEKRIYPDISGLPEGSEVDEIKLSILTNTVYVKVKTGKSCSQIYRFDIMDNCTLMMTANSDILIEQTVHNDNLVYENNGNIYVRSGSSNVEKQLKFGRKSVLLGIDSMDRVFAGQQDQDGKITVIYYGKTDEDINEKWKMVELSKPVLRQNIIIAGSGAVYELIEEEQCFRSIDGLTEIGFDGEFIEMTDDYIITRHKNTLKLEVLR